MTASIPSFQCCYCFVFIFFFFNDTATTEIYTLSLHDALPISSTAGSSADRHFFPTAFCGTQRSEEHTSELQSLRHLVCRLLLEKKKAATQWRHDTSTTARGRASARVQPCQ